MQKAIIEVEWLPTDTDRMCGCCRNRAIVVIKIGNDFGTFSQTTTVPFCNEHINELKKQLA